MMHSVNPATGETLGRFPFPSVEEIEAGLADAAAAQQQRALKDISGRVALLTAMAGQLRAQKEPLTIFWTYASIDASIDATRTILATGVTTRIDEEHGGN